MTTLLIRKRGLTIKINLYSGVLFPIKNLYIEARNFGAKSFGEKILGGKNFVEVFTISVIAFGASPRRFGGSKQLRCCQLKLEVFGILTSCNSQW